MKEKEEMVESGFTEEGDEPGIAWEAVGIRISEEGERRKLQGESEGWRN